MQFYGMNPTILRSALLLVGSNVFITFAWYAHLKNLGTKPLIVAILASWGIAFFEYTLQVPANRIGYGALTLGQLKVMQEVITLSVFAGFSVLVLGEPLRWTYLAAMACLVAAVGFLFLPVD